MTTHSRLRLLFHAAAIGSLATTSQACSESTDVSSQTDRPFPREDFPIDVCGADGTFDALEALADAAPNDSVTRRTLSFEAGLPDGGTTVLSTQTLGTECGTATDPPACSAEVASQPVTGGFHASYFLGGSSGHDFVFTRGDEVGRIADPAALRAFVGAIESAGEAALLALHGPGTELVYDLDCSQTHARATAGGFELVLGSGIACGLGNDRLETLLRVAPDGTVSVLETRVVARGTDGCAIGRLTEGVCPKVAPPPYDLGSFLAEMAELEASAVFAFDRLAAELTELGAPLDLISRARRSAADERRHASMVGALAERHGGSPCEPVASALPLRDRLRIARENAEEGLVRESFGASLATYQAMHAQDEELRRLFERLARDETRHAALSVDLARWLDAGLDEHERAEVARSRHEAAARFRASLARETPERLRAPLGLPGPREAARMLTAVLPAVWALVDA